MVLSLLFLLILPPAILCLSLARNSQYPPYGCQNFGDCDKLAEFSPMQCAEGYCACLAGYTGTWCEIDLNVTVCASNPCTGNTVCEEAGASLYRCKCAPGFNGPNCDAAVADPCTAYDPCGAGTCTNDATVARGYTCACTAKYYGGQDCSTKNYCNTDSNCIYGGACQDNNRCMCPKAYWGMSCTTYTVCALVNGNPDYGCLNGGRCNQYVMTWTGSGWGTGATNYNCKCKAGWTGNRCQTPTDECASTPCLNGGTCIDAHLAYSCQCPSNFKGTNCEIPITPCDPYTKPDGTVVASPCQEYDASAVCTNVDATTYACTCGPLYTNTKCDLTIKAETTLIRMYSPMNSTDVLPHVEKICETPATFTTTFTFQLGSMTEQERMDLSWNVEDLFQWIAYEDEEIDLTADLYKWNDVFLGNCFTFNHRNLSFSYQARRHGEHGGLRAALKLEQDEYLPYIETAGINVYIHDKNDDVYYESLGFAPKPVGEALMAVEKSSYTNLPFRGACVKSAADVEPYYYQRDVYTQEACYRSCYQSAVVAVCECADPLYASPPGISNCNVSRQTCVESYRSSHSDPSSWGGCSVCRPSCHTQIFDVVLSQGPVRAVRHHCAGQANQTACDLQYRNQLRVSVILTTLVTRSYVEEFAMTFIQFLSKLGGLLGVLCGLSVFGFIEFAVLILILLRVLVFKK